MEEQLILTALTLRLNPRVRRASPIHKIAVLKEPVSGRHLTVTDKQWDVLRQFLNPITVPEVIRVLLLNRACLPLREFYELILKAHRAGILIHEPVEPPPEEVSWNWWRFPGTTLLLPALGTLVVIGIWLALYPLPIPSDWQISWPLVALGAFATSVCLSLGDLLAAMALSKAGVSPPAPHFAWLTLCPRLAVTLTDVRMLRPLEQLGVWAARTLPLASLILGLVAWQPLATVVPFAALFLRVRPFGEGSLVMILAGLVRGYPLDTLRRPLFSLNRGLNVRVSLFWKRLSVPYVSLRLLFALLWVGVLVFLIGRTLGPGFEQVYRNQDYWIQAGWYAAWVSGGAVLLLVVPLTMRALGKWVLQRVWACVAWTRRWLSDSAEYSSHAAILHTMGTSPVFRRLGQIGRLGLVVAGRVERLRPWRTMESEKENLPVGLILSGRVALFREALNGRWYKVAVLEEGDILGSETWSDPDGGRVRCRTLSPVILLTWTPEVFGRQIFSVLGSTLSADLMVKMPFLRGLPMCRNWHPQALVRFAQIARLSQFGPDIRVITESDAVLWFFVIYTGRVITRKKRVRRATLSVGDYFGELSLLRNDVATADVITLGPARCVLIHRPEFMRFMTHNPAVALELERVSSQRLGRPVFPYKP